MEQGQASVGYACRFLDGTGIGLREENPICSREKSYRKLFRDHISGILIEYCHWADGHLAPTSRSDLGHLRLHTGHNETLMELALCICSWNPPGEQKHGQHRPSVTMRQRALVRLL